MLLSTGKCIHYAQPTHEERTKHFPRRHSTGNINCFCDNGNVLVKPASLETACYVYNNLLTLYGISSNTFHQLSTICKTIYPEDVEYSNYRQNYNKLQVFFPGAICLPRCTKDVQEITVYIRRYKLPFRVRSGRHAYQPASLMNFGLIVDLGQMDSILELNKDKVIAQSGILLGRFINRLSKHNLILPIGTCPTNGLAGFTLGGGFGSFQRALGLCMDHVIEYTIVLANGRVLHPSKDKYQDLFFALRGAGGGNYGIITEITFKPIYVDSGYICNLEFPFSRMTDLLDFWQRWSPPKNITFEINVSNPSLPIHMAGVYIYGSTKDVYQTLKPLLSKEWHTKLEIELASTNEIFQYLAAGGYARAPFFYNKGNIVPHKLPRQAFQELQDYMATMLCEDLYVRYEFNRMGGAIRNMSDNETAFPYRNAKFWWQVLTAWVNPVDEPKYREFVNRSISIIQKYLPHSPPRYVNFIDLELSKEEALQSYFAENLPRLMEIKKRYDPEDIFSWEQSIPLPQ